MRPPPKSWLAAWWPSLLWMVLIFIGSSLSGGTADDTTRKASGVEDPVDIQRIKDIAHVTEYGILMLLLARSLRLRGHKNAIPLGFAIAVLYGLTDEAHQYFVPERYPSIEDLIRDTAGAGLGAVVVYVRKRRKVAPKAEYIP